MLPSSPATIVSRADQPDNDGILREDNDGILREDNDGILKEDNDGILKEAARHEAKIDPLARAARAFCARCAALRSAVRVRSITTREIPTVLGLCRT